LFLRINDFYKEVNDNINVNQTFSIDDIEEEQRLNRFYITGEEIAIENILEDSELLIENSEKMLGKLETVIQFQEASASNDGDASEPVEIRDVDNNGEQNE
jgi:predicted metal-dependent hydrolase